MYRVWPVPLVNEQFPQKAVARTENWGHKRLGKSCSSDFWTLCVSENNGTQSAPAHLPMFKIKESFTRWWFQPIWKICSSNWSIFPNNRDENSKNIWVATNLVFVSKPYCWNPPLGYLNPTIGYINHPPYFLTKKKCSKLTAHVTELANKKQAGKQPLGR